MSDKSQKSSRSDRRFASTTINKRTTKFNDKLSFLLTDMKKQNVEEYSQNIFKQMKQNKKEDSFHHKKTKAKTGNMTSIRDILKLTSEMRKVEEDQPQEKGELESVRESQTVSEFSDREALSQEHEHGES